jgi:hypothetical protein
MKHAMKNRLNIATSLALLLLFAKSALAGDIMVMNPVAAESLTPAATTGVAYLSIMNHGTSDDALVAVSTPAAERTSIHETTMENDVMKMSEVARFVVPAGATVDLLPAGPHLMLMGLRAPLRQGDSIPLTLTFEKAGEVKADAPVVDRKSLPAAHMHHGASGG